MTRDGMDPIRVVIIDDHALVADGVAALLRLEADIDVRGSAATVEAGHALILAERPDVVILDIQLGDRSGYTLLEQFAGGTPAFVMFSSHDHPAYHKAAFERGAAGYVLKDGSTDQLVEAVRAAAAGRTSFSVRTLRAVREDVKVPSERELQIVRLVAEGRSNDEMAHLLGIRPKTVESHLRTLFDRYGVVSRTELALHAVHEGWIRRASDAGGEAGRWIADGETLGATKGRVAGTLP